MFVLFIVAVVLVKGEAAFVTGIYGEGEGRVVGPQVLGSLILGDNASGLDVERILVKTEVAGERLAAAEERARGRFVPVGAGGEPHLLVGQSVGHGRRDGLHEHLVAKHVLILMAVGLRGLGIDRKSVVEGKSV